MDEIQSKPVILIVDDVPANIKILGESLKKEYKIRLATAGPKAMKIASSPNPPDLILLDIMMPDMDGYEVCKRLKAQDGTKNIPVIFITARDQEEDETKGLEIGAVDYITKPFSLPIVSARVRTHLELKHHRDILENLSTLDGLTGVPNRRRFEDVFTREWKRSVREFDLVSLLMIDIDYFKYYNDGYGHVAGDDCLRKVAQSLQKSACRPGDFLGRYGGEEFACILPKTDMEGAWRVAENMRREIELLNIPHASSKISDRVTISLGTGTIYPLKSIVPLILIEGADRCLYKAKDAGRNMVKSCDLSIGSIE